MEFSAHGWTDAGRAGGVHANVSGTDFSAPGEFNACAGRSAYAMMETPEIQNLCGIGQEQLQGMQYLEAERTLAKAEELAWQGRDWDSLARLYMPLQESRRQRRQRCGEGNIKMDVLIDDPSGAVKIVQDIKHGQVLIAGAGSIQPAVSARRAQDQSNLYIDVFLGAVYPVGSGRIVAIIPNEDVALPPVEGMSVDALIRRLPAHSITLSEGELRNCKTYADTMALWERLHAPFLAAADGMRDPVRRIEAYRRTIRVDYACELAHQRISDTARMICAGAKT
jgi:hypothetical protein